MTPTSDYPAHIDATDPDTELADLRHSAFRAHCLTGGHPLETASVMRFFSSLGSHRTA
jgi:hypothetical protein